MMLTRIAAQAIVDGFSATALAASVLAIARRPPSLLRPRLCFAFGGAFLLFLSRTLAYGLGRPELLLFAMLVVCILPLAALLLAEGLLRRHAPWPLKLFVTLGAVAVATALIATGGEAPSATWWLGSFVIVSLASVALLLLLREQQSLSAQENAGIVALIGSGVFLTVVSLSDFLPTLPIGSSGIGCAAVALVLGANPSTAREARNACWAVLVLLAVAALGALALGNVLALSTSEQIRMGAILLALLLAANMASTRGVSDASATRLARGLVEAANTTTLESFLSVLAGQPLLAGLRIAESSALADYDAAELATFMRAKAVWTRAALRMEEERAPRARDELADLMTRMDATHAVVVSETPLRIALLTLSDAGPADGAETSLALFHKLAIERP
jgi:hypothetical protein